jgi:hypothetical protein
VRTIIEALLIEQVAVKFDGQSRKMTKQEFIIRSAADEALKGDLRKKLLFFKLLESWAPQSIDPPPPIEIQSIPGDETL